MALSEYMNSIVKNIFQKNAYTYVIETCSKSHENTMSNDFDFPLSLINLSFAG